MKTAIEKGMKRKNWKGVLLMGVVAVVVCACASPAQVETIAATAKEPATGNIVRKQAKESEHEKEPPELRRAVNENEEAKPKDYELFPGTGEFINRRAASKAPGMQREGGDVVLNFEGSDIREVVKTILGDVLGQNYAIDPGVKGTVSLQTIRPITEEAALPTLETLLRMNGAALVSAKDIYLVVPEGVANTGGVGPRLQLSADRGFQILIVPLRYIAAAEMAKILEPIKPEKGKVEVDSHRNHLIVAGTQSEVRNILDTINIFDVDQLQGMSFGLFRLRSGEANTVLGELQKIFGDTAEGPLAGMVRITAIDRLNALIVITPQTRYLEEAKIWIERLDRVEDGGGKNMYVYRVQHRRAEYLAGLLAELFQATGPSQATGSAGSGPRSPSPLTRGPPKGTVEPSTLTRAAPITPALDSDSILGVGEVRIMADDENNALVIMASSADYRKVEAAVRQLDVVPLQVLIEATIVEVSLEGDLSYGLQWFFKNTFGGDRIQIGELFPLTVDPSFSYTLFDEMGAVRAVLNTLAAESKLNVLSSPSLLVLDNRTAEIRVGDQVPIRTSETTSLATSGSDALITSTIQYGDTGVLLEVTPRVNEGGMVTMDIVQEVNDVDQTTTSEIDSPTFIQRRINTSVAVQSGETVVLGGLIRENKSDSKSGVPGLRRIPILGWFFGSRITTSDRTELLVLITPTAVTDRGVARAVTEEMKRKMPTIAFPR